MLLPRWRSVPLRGIGAGSQTDIEGRDRATAGLSANERVRLRQIGLWGSRRLHSERTTKPQDLAGYTDQPWGTIVGGTNKPTQFTTFQIPAY